MIESAVIAIDRRHSRTSATQPMIDIQNSIAAKK